MFRALLDKVSLPSADTIVIFGLYAAFAFMVVSDATRPQFTPSWRVYGVLLVGIAVAMGYEIDSTYLTISRDASEGDDNS